MFNKKLYALISRRLDSGRTAREIDEELRTAAIINAFGGRAATRIDFIDIIQSLRDNIDLLAEEGEEEIEIDEAPRCDACGSPEKECLCEYCGDCDELIEECLCEDW